MSKKDRLPTGASLKHFCLKKKVETLITIVPQVLF